MVHNFDSGLCQHQVATCYQACCIDQNRNIPGLKQLNIPERKNRSIKSQLWNPQTCSSRNVIEKKLIQSYLVRYSLRFPKVHLCYRDKTESVSSMLRKTAITTRKEKKKLSHPPYDTIIEDTIRHNITQVISTSNAYIP